MLISMGPSDLALLVVLGTAERGPVSLKEIVATARLLAPQDWQPTTETIGGAAERAVADGLATVVGDALSPEAALETTHLGRDRMVALLRKPIPRSSGGFIRSCMCAKACFLDCLPYPERGGHAGELAQLYREAVDLLHRLQGLPRPLAGSALDDLRHETVRLESELAWLEGMALLCSGQQAAE